MTETDLDPSIRSWLDAGPRRMAPDSVDRILADLGPQVRGAWLRPVGRWRAIRALGSVAIAGALAVGVLLSARPIGIAERIGGAEGGAFTGRVWELVALDDGQRWVAPLTEWPVRLLLREDGTFAASTSCRAFNGTVSWPTGTGGVTAPDLRPLALTAERVNESFGCSPDLDTQDRRVRSALAAVDEARLTDDPLASGYNGDGRDADPAVRDAFTRDPRQQRLWLRDVDTGRFALVFAPADEPPWEQGLVDVVGPVWRLIAYRSGDAAFVAPRHVDATLVARSEDDLTLDTGCSTLSFGSGGAFQPRSTCDDEARSEDAEIRMLVGQSEPAGPHSIDPDAIGRLRAVPALLDVMLTFHDIAFPRIQRLVLEDAAGVPTLVFAAEDGAPPARFALDPSPVDLVGPTWVVIARDLGFSAPTVAAVPMDGLTLPTLRLSPAGLVLASDGCDDHVGTVDVVRGGPDGGGRHTLQIRFSDTAAYRCVGPTPWERIASQTENAGSAQLIQGDIARVTAMLQPAELPARLSRMLAAWPEVTYLILRPDAGARPQLLLVPLAPDIPTRLDPIPRRAPATVVPSVAHALDDGAWQVIGVRDGGGRMTLADSEDPVRVSVTIGPVTGEGSILAARCPWSRAMDQALALDGSTRMPVRLRVVDRPCTTDGSAPDPAITDHLAGASTITVARLELGMEVAGIPKVDLDPWLWASLARDPGPEHLVVRDAQGAVTLIMRPV